MEMSNIWYSYSNLTYETTEHLDPIVDLISACPVAN